MEMEAFQKQFDELQRQFYRLKEDMQNIGVDDKRIDLLEDKRVSSAVHRMNEYYENAVTAKQHSLAVEQESLCTAPIAWDSTDTCVDSQYGEQFVQRVSHMPCVTTRPHLPEGIPVEIPKLQHCSVLAMSDDAINGSREPEQGSNPACKMNKDVLQGVMMKTSKSLESSEIPECHSDDDTGLQHVIEQLQRQIAALESTAHVSQASGARSLPSVNAHPAVTCSEESVPSTADAAMAANTGRVEYLLLTAIATYMNYMRPGHANFLGRNTIIPGSPSGMALFDALSGSRTAASTSSRASVGLPGNEADVRASELNNGPMGRHLMNLGGQMLQNDNDKLKAERDKLKAELDKVKADLQQARQLAEERCSNELQLQRKVTELEKQSRVRLFQYEREKNKMKQAFETGHNEWIRQRVELEHTITQLRADCDRYKMQRSTAVSAVLDQGCTLSD